MTPSPRRGKPQIIVRMALAGIAWIDGEVTRLNTDPMFAEQITAGFRRPFTRSDVIREAVKHWTTLVPGLRNRKMAETGLKDVA